jgi:GntR family transcriptional repressor for pyruvate dehydrogenase complex
MTANTLFPKPVERSTLADRLAVEIKRLILSETLKDGDSLPSETELAEQYGVSRAVIRDATRILMALGLVEVIHGKGVFVTSPQNNAFGEALLLALQRRKATVWDVEHFELLLFPQVVSLAAVEATDEELDKIRALTTSYLNTYDETLEKWSQESTLAEAEQEELRNTLRSSYRLLIESIFDATHNMVLQILANPLLKLRNLRDWQTDETPVDLKESERAYFQTILEAIESRDPELARDMTTRMMQLPEKAIEAMQRSPVGEIPQIVDASKSHTS